MPTVLREKGFRFYFYSHEPNEPPHVHVDKGGASAKFWLQTAGVASATGFSAHELTALHRLVRERRVELLEAWHDVFGT